ncbi:hypothetical protein BO70DRAFT_349548 [Aspergillus heteromorphus CBS 117.55]|uniref:AB hydrolase-1 domain-containing protein n=1 Tax=Aspergillus heteromorphus CBS 117.55 TaxID=1448321 RepID=A0A317WX99_9EURO|nr:uncharacterized protein BO70DRAFT_349548 [Aspergillus heteromorphus CBS 117.55]PWY91036.1 hypothetical protein BO70DRAFT_349548 [Aspergillus heteromorphus CBS 117.55]
MSINNQLTQCNQLLERLCAFHGAEISPGPRPRQIEKAVCKLPAGSIWHLYPPTGSVSLWLLTMNPPFPFQVIEHSIPAQHIREHPHGINGRQEAVLQLAIKQYVPLDRPDPIPENAVTIIGAHGTGFPKVSEPFSSKKESPANNAQEVYEPLWEDLYAQLKKQSVPLRGIWVADVSNQGASGVLNEYTQGDNTHWFDHSRDLLHMTNHFRDEMPRPIIGIAHSMGCAQLIHLSILHPRLLSTLILYEPVILDIPTTPSPAPNPSLPAALKPDFWPTRATAETYFAKALRKWDPRARARYLQYGLRNIPTRLYPTSTPSPTTTTPILTPVTLTTTKHHEAWSYSIPNLTPPDPNPKLDRLLLPDWDRTLELPVLFSRPECLAAMRELPFVRPSVLWVFAGRSYLSGAAEQDRKMSVTGTGTGGSGGAQEGKVSRAVLEKGGHGLVVEEVGWCAGVAGEWVARWKGGWLEEEAFWKAYRSGKSDGEMLRSSEVGMEVMRMRMGSLRGSVRGKL